MDTEKDIKYVGFWLRLLATIIDNIILMVIIIPILIQLYGLQNLTSQTFVKGPVYYLINYVLPSVAVILLWKYKAATPGKMIIKAKIVDADTLGFPTNKQLIIRFFAYLISTIPICLGFIWIAFDKKKQSWHDKLAKTLVVREK